MALTVEVEPGTHTIKITKNGYFPIKFDVDVKAGETKNISRTLIETDRFTIEDFSVPSSAYVGDTIYLTVSIKNNSSVSDTAKVVLYCDRSEVDSKTVDLLPGGTNDVNFEITFDSTGSKTLIAKVFVYVEEHELGSGWYDTDTASKTITIKEKTATITITTTPSGAAVYVDGVYKGTT